MVYGYEREFDDYVLYFCGPECYVKRQEKNRTGNEVK